MKKEIKILAIETSCDETAAAVLGVKDGKPIIISNIVSSQIDLHSKTGGIVPEVASRAHMEAIVPVINEALIAGQDQNSKFKTKNDGVLYSKKLKSPASPAGGYQLQPELLDQITHVAVTAGPGLIGSLLVGFNTAKSIAYAKDLPIVPINHIEGHIYSALLAEQVTSNKKQATNKSQISNSKSEYLRLTTYDLGHDSFPALALTVSGGHTALTLIHDHGKYETIGQTRDDAAGEAFDKVAKLLGLGFPGGPAISILAREFRDKMTNGKYQITNKISNSKSQKSESKNLRSYKLQANKLVFPRPMINEKNFDFSYSGLKTAVLTHINKLKTYNLQLTTYQKEEIACAFEDAAVDLLVTKTVKAVKEHKPKAVLLAGGVAANRFLRNRLTKELKNLKIDKHVELKIAPMNLCGDNAAMIGLAAYYHIIRGDVKNWDGIKIDSNFML